MSEKMGSGCETPLRRLLNEKTASGIRKFEVVDRGQGPILAVTFERGVQMHIGITGDDKDFEFNLARVQVYAPAPNFDALGKPYLMSEGFLNEEGQFVCHRGDYIIDRELDADQLRAKYARNEHPRHCREHWKAAVSSDDTLRGYWDWVESMIEQEEL